MSPEGAGPPGVPARYWRLEPAGRLVCELCPRSCRLRDGQRGFCHVRLRQGDRMMLETYGHSTGFCIDPIEKKPLFHFLPGSGTLSFGTAGCNLACRFCQNWSTSRARSTRAASRRATPENIARTARRLGCHSVSFTYNDPVIFLEYAVDVAQACHAEGLRTVAVTAGYINPRPAEEFFAHMDAANVDLKAFSETFYRRMVGGHLAPVLDLLGWLHDTGRTWMELTTLLIPEANDSPRELADLSRWVVQRLGADVPVHFSAFHPDYRWQHVPRTPRETLIRAREQARALGLRHVYTGNVVDFWGAASYCHACGQPLILRNGYDLVQWNLRESGRCGRCGEPCAGVFAPQPGRWGSRRMPVDIPA
ncbi:MAG: AmmeMemoRadiSam system radical SAM enzyme [Magnetococcus sp. WYHC-3]